METRNRIVYEAPTADVVEVKFDGILCQSILGSTSATMDGVFTELNI